MKINKLKKAFCGVVGTAMLCTMLPAVYAVDAEDDVIFSSSFENAGDVSEFTGRGGVETIEVTTTSAHTGDSSMLVSGRTKNWNGPQFSIDDKCETGVEYIVNAWVKTEWYNNVNLSMEYTDASGERKYPGLKSAVSQGDWVEIEAKFSVPEDVTKVYLYFQCNDTANIYVDDFKIVKAPVRQIENDIPSLKDVYSPYFKIGTAVTTSELAPQSTKDLISKHFNSITLGNELKPDAILDRNASIEAGNDNPQVNLASARTILNYCRDNNIPVRGHVLVWHSQTPDWFFKENYADDGEFVSKEVMLVRMENYIKNVFEAVKEEYPDVDFYAWDVVNEIWLDGGVPRNPGEQGSTGSNDSAWVKVFGDNSFVDYAFEYARKYAPEGCKLYYNDFNEYMPQKTDAIVEMANRLKEKGLIDGIGMQSHLDVTFPGISAYKKALEKFAATGLDIQVTELDATTSDLTEAGFEKQAQYYSDIMDAIMEYKDNISAVVFWGTTDDKSWRASKSPLLFNEDYTAKPAFYSIVDGLDIPDPTTATTVATEATTETKETTVTTAITTEKTSGSAKVLYGDANDDGAVDVADVVAVASYVGDSSNKLKSLENADVHSVGNGVTADDALVIQQYLAKIVTTLPVE